MNAVVELRPAGLYCPAGDFYIDPWKPVERALITHAHADHARYGHRHYLTAAAGEHVLRARLPDIDLQLLPYGESLALGSVRVSFHPAGHVLGSAQIRLEYRGEVWVVSGDYKVQADPTCAAFEPVRCHTFITESTFGLPIYRWPPGASIFAAINKWWQGNAASGRCSVVYAYSFGKAQRLLAGVDSSIGPLICHGAVATLNDAYRRSGVSLPETRRVDGKSDGSQHAGALVVAPPSAADSPWLRRFGDSSDGFASGWMQLRGARRRRSVDQGFVLSDHADWPGLLSAIEASGASRVLVTHGYADVLARYLCERGLDAGVLDTEFVGEAGAEQEIGP